MALGSLATAPAPATDHGGTDHRGVAAAVGGVLLITRRRAQLGQREFSSRLGYWRHVFDSDSSTTRRMERIGTLLPQDSAIVAARGVSSTARQHPHVAYNDDGACDDAAANSDGDRASARRVSTDHASDRRVSTDHASDRRVSTDRVSDLRVSTDRASDRPVSTDCTSDRRVIIRRRDDGGH